MKLFFETMLKVIVLALVTCFAFFMLKGQIELPLLLLIIGLFFLAGVIVTVRDIVLNLEYGKRKTHPFPNYQKPEMPEPFKDYAGDVVNRLKKR